MILKGSFFSEALGHDTGLSIVTPARGGTPPYKVCYLLHGLGGNTDTWVNYSLLPVYAMQGNTIYIIPEAGRSFYADMEHGSPFFTYITQELPLICQNLFHITAQPENTAIMGASMGGYGALKCALNFPEKYGMCAAFSPALLFIREGLEDQRQFGKDPDFIETFGQKLLDDFSNTFGDELEWKPEIDVEYLAAQEGPKPQIYLACGTLDPYYEDALRYTQHLAENGVEHVFEAMEGGMHEFTCFDAALQKAIQHFGL